MKISIITVNYNDKVGLEKTIQSVLSQENATFEFLVIDGNSSDGSKDVIDKYKGKINYWASEPDSGIYNAMNKGIKAATGDYLLFLNSGDWLCANDTIVKVDKLIDGNSGIYYGNAIFKDKIKEEIVTYPEKLTFHFFTYNNLCHQATFIKKSLFETVFYYNENFKIISDWEFLIYSICLKNCSYKHLNEIICYYDFEGISSNENSKGQIKKETDIVMNKYFPAFIDDYKYLNELNSKRVKKILYLKQFPIAWGLIKAFSNIISVFLPKKK